ncbi:MAG: hypothetical protein MZU97_10885 [Bacillus subtilis]|nr:hypothetical protein [Bacillus subtilis]
MILKPKKLTRGDTIGIISPSGSVKEDDKWQLVVEFFEKRGYKIKISPNAKNKKPILREQTKKGYLT